MSKNGEEVEENRASFDRGIPRDDDDTPPPLNCRRSIDNWYVVCPRDTDRASFYLESIEFANELRDNGLWPSSCDEAAPRPTRAKIPKQSRSNSVDQRRRSSVQSNRSRTNSCSRPTPLGRRQLGHRSLPTDGNTHMCLSPDSMSYFSFPKNMMLFNFVRVKNNVAMRYSKFLDFLLDSITSFVRSFVVY